jgi:hypothetical protein
MKKLLSAVLLLVAFVALPAIAGPAVVNAKQGAPVVASLSAGEAITINAVDVPAGKCADFGLYANPGTHDTANGVSMRASDYYHPRVFTFGAESGGGGVAHLFTCDRTIRVTAADQNVGTFAIVTHAIPSDPARMARITRGQKKSP